MNTFNWLLKCNTVDWLLKRIPCILNAGNWSPEDNPVDWILVNDSTNWLLEYYTTCLNNNLIKLVAIINMDIPANSNNLHQTKLPRLPQPRKWQTAIKQTKWVIWHQCLMKDLLNKSSPPWFSVYLFYFQFSWIKAVY